MNSGLVLVTWSKTIHLAKELLQSSAVSSSIVPIAVVVNEIESLIDYDVYRWINENYPIYPIEGNRWEVGAIEAAYVFSGFDEFILIQDTLEIKDMSVFEAMLSVEGHSIAYNSKWECYLGKYRRAVLDKMTIPYAFTKLDALYWEIRLPTIYNEISEQMEGHRFLTVNDNWGNNNPDNYHEEKFGRKNIVLADDYIIKRKSIEWKLPNNMLYLVTPK